MSMEPPFQSETLPGMSYYPSFITRQQELTLLHEIDMHPRAWKSLKNRTLQNWGGLPHIKGMLPTSLPPFLQPICKQLVSANIFPHDPNHVLINRYRSRQGIDPHLDGPAYKPIAAIVSLEAPIVMDFFRVDDQGATGQLAASMLLRPRSLLVLQRDVYTNFMHSIAERPEDILDQSVLNCEPHERGTVITRSQRTSLTIRTSCKTIKNPLGRLFAKA